MQFHDLYSYMGILVDIRGYSANSRKKVGLIGKVVNVLDQDVTTCLMTVRHKKLTSVTWQG